MEKDIITFQPRDSNSVGAETGTYQKVDEALSIYTGLVNRKYVGDVGSDAKNKFKAKEKLMELLDTFNDKEKQIYQIGQIAFLKEYIYAEYSHNPGSAKLADAVAQYNILTANHSELISRSEVQPQLEYLATQLPKEITLDRQNTAAENAQQELKLFKGKEGKRLDSLKGDLLTELRAITSESGYNTLENTVDMIFKKYQPK